MFSITNVVGRLVETTMIPPVTEEDDLHVREVLGQILRRRMERVVVFADYRGAKRLEPEDRHRLTEMLNRFNPDIERSALLVSPANVIVLQQVANIVRRSMHPSRRVFSDASEVEAWLGERLNDEERARLKAALGDHLVAPP